MALHRLIREQERKEKQQQPPPNKLITNIEEENMDSDDVDSEDEDPHDNGSINKILEQLDGASGGEGYSKNQSNREWKGKYRKI